jgi:hypothetical protein
MAGRDRALIVVVEHGGPTMFARIGVLRALNRHHVRDFISLIVAAFLTGKVAIGCAYTGMSEFPLGHHRSCKCGAVYDRSEHIEEAREISSFECAVCGKTIENWNSAWVPRYRFIACPAGKSE